MTVRDLRQKYLAFFESKGHTRHASGSLIPVDVTGRLDESLLFNGAGMVQFKPYFRGIAQPPSVRLCNAQKCVRTGDIDEVGDLSHLTFFEMMGNFSFGDYFKQGAIDLSWEFITKPEWLGLDPRKMCVTVFEVDDVAFGVWAAHYKSVGIDPSCRVMKLGEETNYWPAGAFSKGPPGPCGPNTEMFYWVADEPVPPFGESGQYTRDDYLRDEAQGKWLEFWNDVFIQYEWQGETQPDGGYKKTGMPGLPFESVDTGMGLERAACVLGGFNSVYDTDAFLPILAKIRSLREKEISEEFELRALRIIADHLRAACFCIADGILPSNTGRGYVLRRLIRRAVLKGERVLAFNFLFIHQLVEVIVNNFGDHYTELIEKQAVIVETLRNEEESFRKTLTEGTLRLQEFLENAEGELSGEKAFLLYDTFGFPLEVTQEISNEGGIKVDIAGFNSAMKQAQERSRSADQRDSVYGGVILQFTFESEDGTATPTAFEGYERTSIEARIVGTLPIADESGLAGSEFVLALDRTPFYAESGGQVSDTGILTLSSDSSLTLDVKDVTKQDGVFVHLVSARRDLGNAGLSLEESGKVLTEKLFNQMAQATVDVEKRKAITRNHTATHLLHAALRSALGAHVTQAGSMVSAAHLRFDFTHGKAMSPDELHDVERVVNERIITAYPMTIYNDTPIETARKMGAMALFGEKYGDHVRVVQVGDMPPDEPCFSRELCGGIHVRNTGEIGLFKILHESSAASGVRRIEAVTGLGAYRWVIEQQALLHGAAEKLKSTPRELLHAVEKTLEALREEKKKREKLAQQGSLSKTEYESFGTIELAIEKLEGAEAKDAQLVADRLVDSKPARVAIVSNVADGKIVFVVKCGSEASRAGAHAGEMVKAMASIAGGGGGGRPDFATAGGRDYSKLDVALECAKEVLRTSLGN